MNLSREHFRAMIFYDFKKSLTPLQCFGSLNSVFGDEAPSQRTIYEWYADFKRGRVELCDESREGRPATAVTPENIDAVRNLLQEDHRTIYREIKAHLGIGMTQIKTIIHVLRFIDLFLGPRRGTKETYKLRIPIGRVVPIQILSRKPRDY